jgi:hypothetical protein
MKRLIGKCKDQSGQVLVIFALLIACFCGLVAMVIDVGLFLHEKQDIQNVMDAAALAGAQELPDDGVLAEQKALEYALANNPDLNPADISITFRCIIGVINGQPNLNQVPAACDPGGNASWNCNAFWCVAFCVPSEGDTCNTIVTGGNNDVPFHFAPVIGIDDANTGNIRSAACAGSCGAPLTEPLDVVMVIDRTGSMDANELQDAKDGALTLLSVFNPTYQHVALGVLGAGNPSSPCGELTPTNGSATWLSVPFSSDYKTSGGALNTSSTIVSRVNCLTTSSQGTDLGSPLNDTWYGRTDALDHILSSGRSGVKKAIVLFTDGAANQPVGGANDTGLLSCSANAATTGGDGNGYQFNAANACANGGSTLAEDRDSGNGTTTSCTSSSKDRHLFYDYNISVPVSDSISGVEVRLDGRADSSTGQSRFCVQLSWDGGSTWTTAQQTADLTTTTTTYTLGGSSDDWGHSWANSDVSNSNFRVRVISMSDNNTRDFFLDWVSVRVHHSLTGNPCDYAGDQADVVKSNDIEIWSIGYGLQSEDCITDSPSSAWYNDPVTELLAYMATDSIDETGCDTAGEAAQENADQDNFLCETDSAGLSNLFQIAAEELARGSRLITLPD